MRRSWLAASGSAALALALAAGSSVPALHGQIPAPDGARIETARADPVLPPIRIDVVVTDSRQRPVLDLRPSDFELRVDGRVRSPGSVELRTPPGRGATAPASNESAPSADRPGTRVFAFVLDEFHVSPGVEAERVRQAMSRFIDEHLRPDDVAVILKPLDQVTAIQFTSDRDALRDEVSSFTGRKGDYTPRSAFEEQFIGHAPATVAAARVQLVTVALNELAMQLGELDATRAVVVLFSEGFARTAPRRRGPRLIDLQGLLRAASRFHFAVYTYNPAEAPAESADTAPDPASAMLEWLADQTGGASVLDGRNLAAGLARMSQDLDTYYALSMPAEIADGRFHEVDVRVKRAGVSVRARPGYWAPLSSEVREWLRRATTPGSSTPRRALKRSALIDVWAGVVPAPRSERQMIVTWEPAARPPASRERAEPARVELTARAAGATLFEGTLSPGGGRGDSPRAARFTVPAGLIEIDMRVLGPDGALLDSDIRDVQVPDLERKNATIVLSPQVIRTRTMNEFRTALADPAALPTNARVFSRTDRLVVRLPAWAPDDAAVQAGLRVLNRRGQLIRELEQADSTGGIPQFELPLYWLAPGEYYLEFSGRTDRLEARDRLSIRITG